MAFSAGKPFAKTAAFGLLTALVLAYGAVGATRTVAASPPSDDKSILHLLDRIGYGARPDDVEKVRRMGTLSYIEQQLHPEKIDDRALEARLEPLETIG